MINYSSIARLFVACLATLLLVGHQADGCGLSWAVPQDHFPGVNGKGYVSYFEKVGEVDLGNDLKLPLILNFSSGNEKISPYLGKSFTLYLLESNIVQVGDNSFMATFPDGSLNLFARNNSNETILQGSAGWKAEISGDTINAYAPCGWKLAFYKGHIQSITTPKNRKLEYVYSGNAVVGIRENGTAVFNVEQRGDGQAKAFSFNDKRVQIALDQKPNVQCIVGQNVIGSIDQSLKSLNPTMGTNSAFEFAVNDKVQPTLKITNTDNKQRLFTWDPKTKHIISDNGWSYKFNVQSNSLFDVEIERINELKQSEFWSYDRVNGREIVRNIDGTTFVRSWFVSGPANGKLRKKIKIANGVTTVVENCSYDETGRLIRRFDGHKNTTIQYDANGKIAARFSANEGNTKEKLEEKLQQRINNALGSRERDLAEQKLCWFYIHNLRSPSKAVPIAAMISNSNMRFSVLLHLIDYNSQLSAREKISSYEKLLKEFPGKKAILEKLTENLQKEKKLRST